MNDVDLNRKPIPNFLGIFESKLNVLKDSLKQEIHKPKKDRNKKTLKKMLREAKDLDRTIKSIRSENDKTCPHCGGIL